MTEADLQRAVLDMAAVFKYRAYHTLRSEGSHPGWPDLVLLKPPRLLFVELKSEKGKLTTEQTTWLAELQDAGQEVYVWRPADLDSGAIQKVLT